MAVHPILRYPHPLLKKVCRRVDAVDGDILSLLADLIDTMVAGPGSVGVAAPQIGASVRVCVVDVSSSRLGKENNHGLLALINPEIISGEGCRTMREGCMSVPDYTGDVERFESVTVRYIDPEGGEREVQSSGFEAVALQHEIDHLDGILFLDRISSLKTGLFRRRNYV
jgi:peptide deformylase